MSKPQSSTQWCSSQGRGKADKSVSLTHQASSDETSSGSNVPERSEPVASGTHRHSDAHHSSQLAKRWSFIWVFFQNFYFHCESGAFIKKVFL